jgi:hypothetical protein
VASLDYKISDSDSKYLEPKNSGTVDVINDFQWTLSPKNARIEVPTAIITEYQQTAGQLIASIIYYSKVVQGISNGSSGFLSGPKDPGEVYKFKYLAKPTGFVYNFPYFHNKNTMRSSTFDYEDGQSPFSGLHKLGTEIVKYGADKGLSIPLPGRTMIGELFGVIPAIAGAAQGFVNTVLPGKIALENPRSWVGTDEGSYQFSFDLFNTGSVQDIENNRNLAYILKYQNSPSRRNFAIVDPVVIYDMYIPDIVQLPACYISDLAITNLGNTRQMKLRGVDRIIPEAYRFNIVFTSLFMPTRNLLQALDKGEKVSAIQDSTSIQNLQKAISEGKAKDEMQNEINAVARDLHVPASTISDNLGFFNVPESNVLGPPVTAATNVGPPISAKP